MRNWVISKSEAMDTYMIAQEKAIWLSDQKKDTNILELIESKKLGKIKSIRYEELKEIVFVDSDSTIEFNYVDDKMTDEEFQLDRNTYSDISTYLKNNLKGTEIRNYSVLKQILPELTIMGAALVFFVATYLAALELENGGNINVSGYKSWLKQIVSSIAEVLGTIGTLIIGIIFIGFLTYLVINKVQNPKKGEVLKIKKYPKLSI
ncbi:hypothetical protein LVD13_02345 [Flavobacteriaceae bacterium D16]|nr:hypothetical protein [Flavobacteriaceae bacterium D16]